MDASNPVMTSDRDTVSAILERSLRRKRQDLAFLGEVARTAPRTQLPCNPVISTLEARKIVAEFKASIPKVSSEKEGELDKDVFGKIFEQVPVCGVMDATGLPLHPPGRNQNGGSVFVQRQFGQTPGVPLGLTQVAEIYGTDVLEREHVYTSGTWAGFKTRLKEQMSRKTVPLCKEMARSLGAKQLNLRSMLNMLDNWMPRKPNKNWPGVHTNLADALLEGIKVTSNASAGAPYWRNKGECMEHIIDVGLPIFVKALKENSLSDLWKKNPEFFLCEVKNKLDRYKVDELDRKTRPYVAVPAHIAFLISMMTQGFQETLEVFDRNPKSSNAYGFSSAHGGLERMVDWMNQTTSRGRVVAYGDDARIAIKRDGRVWIVDPDFKQMDGSIDQQDIDLVVDWVVDHIKRDSGDPQSTFWQSMGKVWKKMACDPPFFIDGKPVYVKKSKNGLMTGVPGTTLFDTVKSVVVWNLYLDDAQLNGYDPLREDKAMEFTARNGLIIKPGTWNPAIVPEPGHRQLMTDHKFLGMQIMCIDWYHEYIYVPTLPEKEALEMLVVQKDNPFEKLSMTAQKRRLYDRARGLYITVGFSIPKIREALHNIVNNLDPTVIIMDTQNPFGEKPEHITLQDVNYPDSSGFPSVEWCYNLYSSSKHGPNDRFCWTEIFPTLTPLLNSMKRERKEIGKDLRWAVQINEDNTLSIGAKELEPPPLPEELKEANALDVSQVPKFEEPNPRSHIYRFIDSQEYPEKRVPTRAQVVARILDDVSATQVGTLMDQTGITAKALVAIAKSHGFYMTGAEVDDIISKYPLATPFPTLQEELRESWVENRNLIDTGTNSRASALGPRSQTVVRTAPEEIFMDVGCFVGLHGLKMPLDEEDAIRQLHIPLGVLTGGMRWKTRPVRAGEINPVVVCLEVGGPGRWEVVAEARSISKKLAKGYIASTIFNINGKIVPQSPYTATRNPPRRDSNLWADMVDEEMEPRKGPYEKPTVINIQGDTPDLRPWMLKYPGIPQNLFPALWRHAMKENSSNPYVVLERLLEVRNKYLPEDGEEHVVRSSRSKMSRNQKMRANRALLERRKRKRALMRSQGPLPLPPN